MLFDLDLWFLSISFLSLLLLAFFLARKICSPFIRTKKKRPSKRLYSITGFDERKKKIAVHNDLFINVPHVVCRIFRLYSNLVLTYTRLAVCWCDTLKASNIVCVSVLFSYFLFSSRSVFHFTVYYYFASYAWM